MGIIWQCKSSTERSSLQIHRILTIPAAKKDTNGDSFLPSQIMTLCLDLKVFDMTLSQR